MLTTQGKRIAFYKRAQILVADFWGIMEARGEGNIPNLDYLTMFADYRVPQALVYLGALRYSDTLMETLKKGEFYLHLHAGLQNCSNSYYSLVWEIKMDLFHFGQMMQAAFPLLR